MSTKAFTTHDRGWNQTIEILECETAIMDLDVKIPPKDIIETLRNQIVELESLEATGVATPETCEMLVDLHNPERVNDFETAGV
jgi:hypothetical protein